MKKSMHWYVVFSFLITALSTPAMYAITMGVSSAPAAQQEPGIYAQDVTISIHMNASEYIYYDSLNIVANSPHVTLSRWDSPQAPVDMYDSMTHSNRKVFKGDIALRMMLFFNKGHAHEDVALTLVYMGNNGAAQEVLNVSGEPYPAPQATGVFVAEASAASPEIATALDVEASVKNSAEAENQAVSTQTSSWSDYVSALVQKSNSIWIRLLAVFILGVLLSLTPCIYPMVPITVGILQTHKSTSLWSSFLLSSIYTCGIATTFAALGLVAAFTGNMVGQLLANPFVIVAFIIVLTYLAGSMFGWYEMYTPRFLTNNKVSVKGGSYFSIFLFGAASGCVASPCISPGLILLLTIVSTLGNVFLGFLLLFVFGVGLSMPLLIIGTFSSSLHVLPNAGMWMVEIKKFFGFLLLGMNFYFLSIIMPKFYVLVLFGVFVLASGIYILAAMTQEHEKGPWAFFKRALGVLTIAGSLLVFVAAYKALYQKPTIPWLNNFETAQQQAVASNKKMLFDMSAPFCGICKKIEEMVFSDPQVLSSMKKFIIVKLDDPCQEQYCQLQKKYDIKGVPALLLLEPSTGNVIARWGSELYKKPKQEFIAELEQLSKG